MDPDLAIDSLSENTTLIKTAVQTDPDQKIIFLYVVFSGMLLILALFLFC